MTNLSWSPAQTQTGTYEWFYAVTNVLLEKTLDPDARIDYLRGPHAAIMYSDYLSHISLLGAFISALMLLNEPRTVATTSVVARLSRSQPFHSRTRHQRHYGVRIEPKVGVVKRAGGASPWTVSGLPHDRFRGYPQV